MPYIRDHLENITTTMTRRNFAVKLFDRWAKTLAGFDRCHTGAAEPDLCPDCLDYLPCPLDTWIDTLAAVAVGTETEPVERFYGSRESERQPTNTFYRWLNNGRKALAGAGLAAVVDCWAAGESCSKQTGSPKPDGTTTADTQQSPPDGPGSWQLPDAPNTSRTLWTSATKYSPGGTEPRPWLGNS